MTARWWVRGRRCWTRTAWCSVSWRTWAVRRLTPPAVRWRHCVWWAFSAASARCRLTSPSPYLEYPREPSGKGQRGRDLHVTPVWRVGVTCLESVRRKERRLNAYGFDLCSINYSFNNNKYLYLNSKGYKVLYTQRKIKSVFFFFFNITNNHWLIIILIQSFISFAM